MCSMCAPNHVCSICSTSLMFSTASMYPMCFYVFCVCHALYVCSKSSLLRMFYCFYVPYVFLRVLCVLCVLCMLPIIIVLCLILLYVFYCLYIPYVFLRVLCVLYALRAPNHYCLICSTSLMISTASMSSR